VESNKIEEEKEIAEGRNNSLYEVAYLRLDDRGLFPGRATLRPFSSYGQNIASRFHMLSRTGIRGVVSLLLYTPLGRTGNFNFPLGS
jgi:hypothetical protein